MRYFKSHITHLAVEVLRFVLKGPAVLFLLFSLHPASAEPVWSGNASVDSSEFVNFVEDTPLAGASSSFTRNTVVEVTNPQNGKTIEITIVKRAPRPGIFLVISDAAGEALDFPADQVIPVQVRVVNNTVPSAYDSRFESSDPDINPAANLPEDEESGALVPPDSAAGGNSDTETVPEVPALEEENGAVLADIPPETDSFLEDPVPVPVPDESEELLSLAEETVPEQEPVTPAAEPMEEAVAAVVPEESVSEPETLDEEVADSDNIIYFLTPSDFRPPEVPPEESPAEEEVVPVPVYVERNVLEDKIADQLSKGSSYIQLGAYSSADLIYSEMENIASHYPMVVWTDGSGTDRIYKLLIGPLTPDETGVLLYRFKTGGYSDLFLYRP